MPIVSKKSANWATVVGSCIYTHGPVREIVTSVSTENEKKMKKNRGTTRVICYNFSYVGVCNILMWSASDVQQLISNNGRRFEATLAPWRRLLLSLRSGRYSCGMVQRQEGALRQREGSSGHHSIERHGGRWQFVVGKAVEWDR